MNTTFGEKYVEVIIPKADKRLLPKKGKCVAKMSLKHNNNLYVMCANLYIEMHM